MTCVIEFLTHSANKNAHTTRYLHVNRINFIKSTGNRREIEDAVKGVKERAREVTNVP